MGIGKVEGTKTMAFFSEHMFHAWLSLFVFLIIPKWIPALKAWVLNSSPGKIFWNESLKPLWEN